LQGSVDTLITIPNDRLLQIAGKTASVKQAFSMADDVLRQGIQGISELITIPGLINLDFADVKTIMQDGGAALMAIGRGSGENRAREAAERAIHSALLDVSIEGARAIIFNIKGGEDMSLFEVNEAAEVIRANAHPECNIIFGAVIDANAKDDIQLTVIATGFDRPKPKDQFDFVGSAFNGNGQSSQQTQRTSREPVKEPVADYQVRTFQRDDLDIPAFLRRQRTTNGR
jgi:cell division protein FtsZ